MQFDFDKPKPDALVPLLADFTRDQGGEVDMHDPGFEVKKGSLGSPLTNCQRESTCQSSKGDSSSAVTSGPPVTAMKPILSNGPFPRASKPRTNCVSSEQAARIVSIITLASFNRTSPVISIIPSVI